MMEVEGGADMDGSMMDGDGNNTMTSLDGKLHCSNRPKGENYIFFFQNSPQMMPTMPLRLLRECVARLVWPSKQQLTTRAKMWPIVLDSMTTTMTMMNKGNKKFVLDMDKAKK